MLFNTLEPVPPGGTALGPARVGDEGWVTGSEGDGSLRNLSSAGFRVGAGFSAGAGFRARSGFGVGFNPRCQFRFI